MNPLSWNVGYFFPQVFLVREWVNSFMFLSESIFCDMSLDNGYYLFRCVFLLKRVFSNLKKKVFCKVVGWPAVWILKDFFERGGGRGARVFKDQSPIPCDVVFTQIVRTVFGFFKNLSSCHSMKQLN